jgi:hypothetical protein
VSLDVRIGDVRIGGRILFLKVNHYAVVTDGQHSEEP